MKVGELKKGMLLTPAGDNETFVMSSQPGEKVQWVSVQIRLAKKRKNCRGTRAMYLGNRKDLNMTKGDNSWSNRYILIDGDVAAVDPWSWIRIKKVISESR